MWQFRHLLVSFAVRDYRVRFAQTFLGYAWAVVQPLATLAVLYLVFNKMLKVGSDEVPYFLFALSGLVYWNYFNFVSGQTASSLISAQMMIKKIWFPRLCLPFSKSLVGAVEFAVAFVILLGFAIAHGELSFWGLLIAPLLLVWATLAAQGFGILVSTFSIRHRDVQQVIPFVLQFLFFITPVAYQSTTMEGIIPGRFHFVLYLNPMMGLIELNRHIWFGLPLPEFWWLSLLTAMLLFFVGTYAFNKVEKKMADLL